MKELLIVGAGGFAREVAWLVERINQVKNTWSILGYLDDNQTLWGELVGRYPVLGGCADWGKYKEAWFVCAVGASKTRQKIIRGLENFGIQNFATLIDPSVLLSNSVMVGEGSIICANTIMTVNITVGAHTIVNLGCTIGHDAVLHDFVTLYPSVNTSGFVEIGNCVEIGTGSQIIQGKKVGSETIIGAGSVVIADLPEKCTAVGTPAKPIKFFEQQNRSLHLN